MSEPQSIRVRDVRAVYELIGECLEMWYDARAWRGHYMRGVAQILRGRVAYWLTCNPNLTGRVESSCGWDCAAEEQRLRDLLALPVNEILPEMPTYLSRFRAREFNAFRHSDLMSRSSWLRSACFNEYFRPMNSSGFVSSSRTNATRFAPEIVGTFRPPGDRPFTVRDRKLVELLQSELAPLVGTRLASDDQLGTHHLSRRERQTLQRLLAGESEKQIARALQLSPTTVHDYVRSLYRSFGVNSRAELLSYFIARRPRPQKH